MVVVVESSEIVVRELQIPIAKEGRIFELARAAGDVLGVDDIAAGAKVVVLVPGGNAGRGRVYRNRVVAYWS
ncbi:hypothetical protein GZH49_32460 [Nocardia terpenica]|uniref:hypothetical protein n=1 Tax=Nocardia terpenica TaxID=455432 RepID=UPI002FE3029E